MPYRPRNNTPLGITYQYCAAGAPLLFLAVLLVVAFPRISLAACDEKPPPQSLSGFDDFARAILTEWHVPGLAVGVIQNGETVFCAGYGVSDISENIAVTPDTVFPIGSISKSFTVAGLAMLVDAGQLDWDRPVHTTLPGFALADPIASAQTTARDMISHRAGLARHDMLWYGSGLNRDQLFNRLRHLAPGAPFRSIWQYNNLMVAASGRITEALSGEPWEQFTTRRPVGGRPRISPSWVPFISHSATIAPSPHLNSLTISNSRSEKAAMMAPA